jgi:thiol-disulfide isomerase/thioredoxin
MGLWLCALLSGVASAHAQPQLAPLALKGDAFLLSANMADGARFDMTQLRGKVAVVFYWTTGCAVCRDSLPELRANTVGWRNKPFSLVAVNVDRQAEDWLAYESVLGKMQSPMSGYFSVRPIEISASLKRLPLTLVVDSKGKVIQRIEGRVAPEVWDTVADLIN